MIQKYLSITILLLCFLVSAKAQNVPYGMKYQAVARDLSGNVLANQNIRLKVNLYSQDDRVVQYSETHASTTNLLGLFSLTIGEGDAKTGSLDQVPWSTENIWMELAIDEDGGHDFVTISNSKLLAVPYAFHAATANRLSNGDDDQGNPRNAAHDEYWIIGGNDFSAPEGPGPDVHTFGTLNAHDLIMITNNTPAMTISGDDGAVDIVNDLAVEGSLAVNRDAVLGGALEVKGTVLLNTEGGMTDIYEATQLKKTLSVGEATTLHSSLDVLNGASTYLTGRLGVDGLTMLNNDTESTAPSNGALVVRGGTGIGKNLNVDGNTKINKTLTVDGKASINNTLNVISGETPNNSNIMQGHVAHFENTTDGHGITIKVGAANPQNKNNFITFLNNSNGVVGRIEGESTSADFSANREYQDDLYFFDVDRGLAITDLTISTAGATVAGAETVISVAEIFMAVGDAAAAATSTTVCAGVGACVTSPVPSLIAASAVNVITTTANAVLTTANGVLAIANVGLSTADLALVETSRARFIETHEALKGITFASGAEDYAEYLTKVNPEEDFLAGEVVGLKNGFISRNTLGADRIMVISFKPAVLGGLPKAEEEYKYEKVAFLGQIPTRMIGKVEPGDFVLPSGFHNGYAIAKHPDKMLLSDYKKILGVAWEGSGDKPYSLINVAVGLNVNDLSGVVQKQQEELSELKKQIAQTNHLLAELVPGFKEAAHIETGHAHVASEASTPSNPTLHTAEHDHDHDFITHHDVGAVQPDESNIFYYVPERAEYEKWIEMARQVYLDSGGKIEDHPFWNRLATDVDYVEEVIQDLEAKFDQAIHYHVDVNKKD